MRPVTISDKKNTAAALNEIERASHENDIVDIAQAFTVSGFTQTLVLNSTAPTLANTNAVLATLINLMQKGGLHRTQ